MRKFLPLAVVTVALLLVVSVAPGAASSPPLGVTFHVYTKLDAGGNYGPFVASGPAVDAGLICSSGNTIDISLKVLGDEWPKGVNYQVFKKFTCTDPANSFVAKMQVRDDRKGDNYSWIITEGTGDYERLRGTGRGEGFYVVDPSFDVLDVFEGAVHID